MLSGSQANCVIEGFAGAVGQLRHGSRLAGRWTFECFDPLSVGDPEKLQHEIDGVFGVNFLGVDQRSLLLNEGRLHLSAFERMLRSDRIGPQYARHLESLVSGGSRRFIDRSFNLLVDVGLTQMLDIYFRAGAGPYTAGWYVGLTSASPTKSAADTMSSHSGWTEVTAYSESVRQTYTPAAAASKSITNSASKATFSINANGTAIGGAFLTSNSTKSGTSGTLCSVCAASQGDQTLGNGSTLQVTCTYTNADDATGG